MQQYKQWWPGEKQCQQQFLLRSSIPRRKKRYPSTHIANTVCPRCIIILRRLLTYNHTDKTKQWKISLVIGVHYWIIKRIRYICGQKWGKKLKDLLHIMNHILCAFNLIDSWHLTSCNGVAVGFEQHFCMWGEESLLKTRVVTHPGADDAWPQLTLTTAANHRATLAPPCYNSIVIRHQLNCQPGRPVHRGRSRAFSTEIFMKIKFKIKFKNL